MISRTRSRYGAPRATLSVTDTWNRCSNRSRRSHASISGRLRQARPRSLFARAASLAAWAPGGAAAGPGTAEDRMDEQPDSTVVSMMVRKRTPTWGVRSKGPATTVKPGCAASEPPPIDQLVTGSVSFERRTPAAWHAGHRWGGVVEAAKKGALVVSREDVDRASNGSVRSDQDRRPHPRTGTLARSPYGSRRRSSSRRSRTPPRRERRSEA